MLRHTCQNAERIRTLAATRISQPYFVDDIKGKVGMPILLYLIGVPGMNGT